MIIPEAGLLGQMDYLEN